MYQNIEYVQSPVQKEGRLTLQFISYLLKLLSSWHPARPPGKVSGLKPVFVVARLCNYNPVMPNGQKDLFP